MPYVRKDDLVTRNTVRDRAKKLVAGEKKKKPHDRFLSDWGSDEIVLDVSKDADGTDTKTIDLSEEYFPCHIGKSIYRTPWPISKFSHIAQLCKVLINEKLENGSTDVRRDTRFILANVKTVYSVIFKNAFYFLSDVSRKDWEKIILDLAESGMDAYLEKELLIDDVIARCLEDEELHKKYVNRYHKRMTLNTEALEKETGLSLITSPLRVRFLNTIATTFYPDIELDILTAKENVEPENKAMNSKVSGFSIFHFINKGSDQFNFPEIGNVYKFLGRSQEGKKTENLNIKDTQAILTRAMDLVFNESVGILELLSGARDICEGVLEIESSCLTRKMKDTQRAGINDLYGELCGKYDYFKEGRIALFRKDSSHVLSVYESLRKLQVACLNLIGINTARRKGEINGEESGILDYGLYLGCLEQDKVTGLYKCEFYNEKKQEEDPEDNWKTYSVNSLVVESIKVLEEIYQLTRPLNTDPIDVSSMSVSEKRKLNLFDIHNLGNPLDWGDQQHRYTHSNKKGDSSIRYAEYARTKFDSELHLPLFWKEVEVENEAVKNKTHIFRRLFANVYKHRFALAEILALQGHLGHENLTTTLGYVGEAPDTKHTDTYAFTWKRDWEPVLDNADREYSVEKIKDVLEGKTYGGNFPKIIIDVLKKLAQVVDYSLSEKDAGEIAVDVEAYLYEMGYCAGAKSNGDCWCATNKVTAANSNCFDDDMESINPHLASPKVCGGCIHLGTPEEAIWVMNEDIKEMEQMTKGFRSTPKQKKAAEIEVKELKNIVRLETIQADKNKQAVREIFDSYPEVE